MLKLNNEYGVISILIFFISDSKLLKPFYPPHLLLHHHYTPLLCVSF